MTKPEWGQKRTCQECGAKFYDMRRPQIICPKCGSEFVPVTSKPKRGKPEPKPEAQPKKKPELVEADVESVDDEELEEVADDEEEEDEDLIEDASDLGDDEEDVAEVMEKIDGEKDV